MASYTVYKTQAGHNKVSVPNWPCSPKQTHQINTSACSHPLFSVKNLPYCFPFKHSFPFFVHCFPLLFSASFCFSLVPPLSGPSVERSSAPALRTSESSTSCLVTAITHTHIHKHTYTHTHIA